MSSDATISILSNCSSPWLFLCCAAGAAIENHWSSLPSFSITEFLAYFSKNPNDSTATLLPELALSIIGDKFNAIADLARARPVSRDPISGIAETLFKGIYQYYPPFMDILNEITLKHPRRGEASAEFGSEFLSYCPPKIREAESALIAAIDLAKRNFETNETWYDRAINNMENIYSNKGDIDDALKYSRFATEACDSSSSTHFGMCKWYLINGDRKGAQQCFRTARSLRKTIIPLSTLEEYVHEVLDARMQTLPLSLAGPHSSGSGSSGASSGGGNGYRGGGGGGGGGKSGKGGGSGDDGESLWKRIKKMASCVAECKGRFYVQSKDGAYWYTRDKAGHGGRGRDTGAFLKVYKNKKSTLEFEGSLDINMKPIEGKHESTKVPTVKKSDLNIRRGEIKKK